MTEYVQDDTPHASLGPSGSSRWLNCAGSVKAVEGYPDESGEPAARGTVGHFILENHLSGAIDPVTFLDKTVTEGKFDIKVDAGMIEDILLGYDLYKDAIGEDPQKAYKDGRLKLEERLDLQSFLGPNQFGTSDVIYLNLSENRLVVGDHKFGRVHVNVEDNSQLAIYALGSFNSLDAFDQSLITTVDIYVYQPASKKALSLWSTTPEHLKELEAQYRTAAIATMQEDAPRSAGSKQCQYCAAKADCFEHAKWLFEDNQFETLYDCEPEKLTTEQLVVIYEKSGDIKKYIESVEKHLTRLTELGKVDGYILAQGRRGNTRYVDKEVAEELLVSELGDDAYIKTLLSPAKAAKLLDAETMNNLTERPEGKLKLKKVNENE